MPKSTLYTSLSVFSILDFARRYDNIMREVEQAAVSRDLPAEEARLLSHIISNPGTQAAIARQLSTDTGLLNRRVSRLKEKGLIVTLDDGTRWPPLKATETGETMSIKAASRLNRAVDEIFSKLTPTELASFYEAANRLGEHRFDPDVRGVLEYREAKPREMAYVLESIVGADDEPNDYGFDQTFEAYVLEMLAAVAWKNLGPGYFVLIAEMQGKIVGSIICGSKPDGVIEFLLLTERYGYMDRNIGATLIAEAVTRARSLGFKKAVATTYDGISGSQPYRETDWQPAGSTMEDTFGQIINQRAWTLDL